MNVIIRRRRIQKKLNHLELVIKIAEYVNEKELRTYTLIYVRKRGRPTKILNNFYLVCMRNIYYESAVVWILFCKPPVTTILHTTSLFQPKGRLDP